MSLCLKKTLCLYVLKKPYVFMSKKYEIEKLVSKTSINPNQDYLLFFTIIWLLPNAL